MEMNLVIVLVQFVAASLAAGGVLRMYRAIARRDRLIGRIVGAGFLVRAFFGQILFWISYLKLPIDSTMPMGGGFWWFGAVSVGYFKVAVHAAYGGLVAILSVQRSEAAPSYVQLLALAVTLFGCVASVGLLLNLAAYLGTCYVASSLYPKRSWILTFVIAAISLSPSAILWSLQPLKAITLMFLITAFFRVTVLGHRWAGQGRIFYVAGLGHVLAGLVWMISGVRWYFGCALVLAIAPFFLIVTARSRSWLRIAAISVAAFVASVCGFLAGA